VRSSCCRDHAAQQCLAGRRITGLLDLREMQKIARDAMPLVIAIGYSGNA
jgi:hypothetical protein